MTGVDSEEAYLGARMDEAKRIALDKEIQAYDHDVEKANVRCSDAKKAVEGQAVRQRCCWFAGFIPKTMDLRAEIARKISCGRFLSQLIAFKEISIRITTPFTNTLVEGLGLSTIKVLEAADADARSARDKAEAEKTHAAMFADEHKRTSAALQKTARELKRAEDEYAVLGRLAYVAKGQNQYRLLFQRFVLAALLDDVLIAASQRLRRMSKGRYRLDRVTIQGDQRVPVGLDLQVEDAYTDKERPVSSLSGGESFLAALSLALGLAEVVEVYAGGSDLARYS